MRKSGIFWVPELDNCYLENADQEWTSWGGSALVEIQMNNLQAELSSVWSNLEANDNWKSPVCIVIIFGAPFTIVILGMRLYKIPSSLNHSVSFHGLNLIQSSCGKNSIGFLASIHKLSRKNTENCQLSVDVCVNSLNTSGSHSWGTLS